MLIRLAAVRIGKHNFKRYLVLGDDVVINDTKVSESYVRLLTSLGVKVRIGKSVVPSEIVGLEFASKLINKDGDQRPLPIGLYLEGSLVRKLQFTTSLIKVLATIRSTEGSILESVFIGVFGRQR